MGTKHLIQIGAKKIFLILDNHVSPTNEFKIKGYTSIRRSKYTI